MLRRQRMCDVAVDVETCRPELCQKAEGSGSVDELKALVPRRHS